MGRMLLSHLGLLLPENSGRLQILEHGKKGFDDAVASLDSIWERETIGVGVVLVDHMPKRRFDYLLTSTSPPDYEEFLQSVGWSVNLWEHTGFRGGLTDRKCGDYAPYFANYSTEIICEVASWMPNDVFDAPEKVIAWKRRVLAKNNVVVVWNLHDEYDPQIVTLLQKDMVQIVITPLPSGLYHMRVYKDNKVRSHFCFPRKSPPSTHQNTTMIPIMILMGCLILHDDGIGLGAWTHLGLHGSLEASPR
jgi:hypothetical protein